MLYSWKEGHLAKECKLQNQVCVHCAEKKKHHRSVYPKTFDVTKTPGAGRNESDKKKSFHTNTTLLQLNRIYLYKLHLKWLKLVKYCTVKKQ